MSIKDHPPEYHTEVATDGPAPAAGGRVWRAGTVMMLLMWAAEWPPDRFTDAGEPTASANPILDYHIVYALVMIALAVVAAGNVWGFGKAWARLSLVAGNPRLR